MSLSHLNGNTKCCTTQPRISAKNSLGDGNEGQISQITVGKAERYGDQDVEGVRFDQNRKVLARLRVAEHDQRHKCSTSYAHRSN